MRTFLFAALAVAMALAVIPDAAMAATALGHLSPASSADAFGPIAMAMTALPMAREFGRKAPDGEDKTLEGLQKQLGETLGEVKEFAKEFKAKSEAGEKVSTETKEKADKALSELEGLRGEITELSQKLAQSRRGGDDEQPTLKSLGVEVANHDEVRAYVDGGCKGTIGFSVKAVTTAAGSAGGLIRPDRQSDIVTMPRMGLRVRDLLTPGRTDGNSIEFAKQVTRTNNAAPVAEGAQKPESVYEWDVDDAPVRTIAHWIPVSRQAMDDIPQLESLMANCAGAWTTLKMLSFCLVTAPASTSMAFIPKRPPMRSRRASRSQAKPRSTVCASLSCRSSWPTSHPTASSSIRPNGRTSN